ncbi:MAG: dienelactone hydrolase family protein, partial [Deltaproteobacteria bacterium]
FALLCAARAPLGAAACFYGAVPERAEELEGICPVVAGYGERDRLFAPASRRLERLLATLGVEHDVVVYPDVGHSYMNQHDGCLNWLGAVSPMHVGYDEAAAEDSWRRMLGFFGRHLGQTATETA